MKKIKKMSILIMDNDKILLKEFKEFIKLSYTNINVYTAQSVQEFLVHTNRYKINMIITDSKIRDLNIQKQINIKEYLDKKKLRNKYIIFLNYDSRTTEREKEENEKYFDEVLIRPFLLKEMRNKISKYIF